MSDEAKPAFDPSQPFEPQLAAKPAFDASKPFQAQSDQGGSGNDFLDQHPTLRGYVQGTINALPAAGAMLGGGAGAITGAAGGTFALPGVGTAAGATELGILGTGAGAAVGSLAKDSLNAWIFGKSQGSSLKNVQNAVGEAGENMAAQATGEMLFKGAGKFADNVVPRAVIDRYTQAADAVKDLIGSSDGDIAEAADQVRSSITQSLDEYRGNMNTQIADALKSSTEEVESQPILQALEDAKSRLNPKLDTSQLAQIEEQISKVKSLADEGGKISVQDANDLKRYMQDLATSAYRNAGESQGGTQVAQAAKSAGAVTRKLVNEAVPEVAQANEKLAQLHWVEDRMNKNLIRAGKPAAGLVSAGSYSPGTSGGNATNAKALRILGDITGQDFLGKAQDVAAMKTFGGDSLFKRGAGAALGAGVGATAAEISGHDPYHGAEAGALFGGLATSPLAVKTAIDTGRYLTPAGVPAVAQTLGQAVMHGTGAANSLRTIGGGQ